LSDIRRERVAEHEQIGELSLLNVGTGDTKISFDPEGPPEDRATAAALVKDMIRRGYAVLVEVGKDDKGPLYRRALDFDEETTEYIVAGLPEDLMAPETHTGRTRVKAPAESNAPKKTKGGKSARRGSTRRVPAGRAKAVAVPRTAGG
jgi:hypothetical protein